MAWLLSIAVAALLLVVLGFTTSRWTKFSWNRVLYRHSQRLIEQVKGKIVAKNEQEDLAEIPKYNAELRLLQEELDNASSYWKWILKPSECERILNGVNADLMNLRNRIIHTAPERKWP